MQRAAGVSRRAESARRAVYFLRRMFGARRFGGTWTRPRAMGVCTSRSRRPPQGERCPRAPAVAEAFPRQRRRVAVPHRREKWNDAACRTRASMARFSGKRSALMHAQSARPAPDTRARQRRSPRGRGIARGRHGFCKARTAPQVTNAPRWQRCSGDRNPEKGKQEFKPETERITNRNFERYPNENPDGQVAPSTSEPQASTKTLLPFQYVQVRGGHAIPHVALAR